MTFQTPDLVMSTVVPDGKLAALLNSASEELPDFVHRVMRDTADPSEVDQMIASLDVVTALAELRKTTAKAAAATDERPDSELPSDDLITVSSYTAWYLHELSERLIEHRATAMDFDAALAAYRKFRPMLDQMITAQRNPESVRVSNL